MPCTSGKAPPKLPNVRAYMGHYGEPGTDQVEFFLRAQAEAV